MGNDFAGLAAAYGQERPLYERLAEEVHARLSDALIARGIRAFVTARAKEVDSFVIKALVGDTYANPLEQIGDKAGVRLIVAYSEQVPIAEDVVREHLHIINRESKLDALAYNENGYLGIHLDARFRDGEEPVPELAGLRVEVQIRTIAQSAWAEVSHEQLYKPPADVADEMKRRIGRLVALVELFDAEVQGFLNEARQAPGYKESQVLSPLANLLLARFNIRRSPDRRLSMLMAAGLVPLYARPPDTIYEQTLEAWIDANADALEVQFAEAPTLAHNPLLTQPEIFMIFERLSNDRLRLSQQWPDDVPRQWLEELAEMWGVALN